MTARELAAKVKEHNPSRRFAIGGNEPGTALAVWDEAMGWRCIAGLLVTGEWAEMPGLLINGKPAITNWIEV